MLGIARVDKKHGKSSCIEKLRDRNPADADRFHDDGLDAAFHKPVYQLIEIGRESAKTAYLLKCAISSYAAMCMVAPTSMAAVFRCTMDIVR